MKSPTDHEMMNAMLRDSLCTTFEFSSFSTRFEENQANLHFVRNLVSALFGRFPKFQQELTVVSWHGLNLGFEAGFDEHQLK